MALRTRTHYWGEFQRWCKSRGMDSLPAHPWTVASFLRWMDRHKDIEDVRAAFKAISREHVLKTGRVPTRHATVKSTMEMIERKALVSDQHADLFDEKELLENKSAPEAEEEAKEESYAESVQRRHVLSTKPRMVRKRPKS